MTEQQSVAAPAASPSMKDRPFAVGRHSLGELYALWDELADIPVADGSGDLDADVLERPFLHFASGTPKEDVWRWMESRNPFFSVAEVQQGIRYCPPPSTPTCD